MSGQPAPRLERLRQFVQSFTRLIDTGPSEPQILDAGTRILAELVAHDDWLPEDFAAADETQYRQFLLHCDTLERFSVVSFVWGPGHKTPIHNHTVWGLVGMLRGAEVAQDFTRATDGKLAAGPRHQLRPGQVTAVSPGIGDIHTVENDLPDRPSISIHVYGGNIGTVQRARFDRGTGAATPFVSGYSNTVLPNIWAS